MDEPKPTPPPEPLEGAPLEVPSVDPGLARARALIGGLLRVGLGASVALMTVGTVVCAIQGQSNAEALHRGSLSFAKNPGFTLNALGIVVLAVTPALRVVSLAILFFAQKDWRFVRLTVAVLLLLVVGLVLGKGG